ncbi:DUF397 domain-containing protein [Nocardia panacis]|uniref:DUF397 domain-containing protein n=1 Tax=Nocardia panacis TaxID=2340916 RepID=A0A3A4KQD4_9NOCA|nr:DUF397 domain-containing protein [Nocardia panacis]RJO79913.1 DUF397 domain-containing protein [Nocardia panacis]
MNTNRKLGWFKSSYSDGQSACVEVNWLAADAIGVRDSKNPTGPALTFAPGAWDGLLASVRGHQFH